MLNTDSRRAAHRSVASGQIGRAPRTVGPREQLVRYSSQTGQVGEEQAVGRRAHLLHEVHKQISDVLIVDQLGGHIHQPTGEVLWGREPGRSAFCPRGWGRVPPESLPKSIHLPQSNNSAMFRSCSPIAGGQREQLRPLLVNLGHSRVAWWDSELEAEDAQGISWLGPQTLKLASISEKTPSFPRRAVHTRLQGDRVKPRAAWASTSGPTPLIPLLRVTSYAGPEGPCQPPAP